MIKEVGLYKQSLNKEDVFVLDNGLKIYQINTPNCDKDEKVGNIGSDIEIWLNFCFRRNDGSRESEVYLLMSS